MRTTKICYVLAVKKYQSSRNRTHAVGKEQVINSLAHSIEEKLVEMAVENNVYLAKLAEQAERYEGKILHPSMAHAHAFQC